MALPPATAKIVDSEITSEIFKNYPRTRTTVNYITYAVTVLGTARLFAFPAIAALTAHIFAHVFFSFVFATSKEQENRDLPRKYGKVLGELATLRSENKTLKSEKSELERQAAYIADLEGQLEAKDKKIAKLSTRIDSELKKSDKENRELKGTLREKDNEIASLKEKLQAEICQKCEALDAQDELKAKIASLSEQVSLAKTLLAESAEAVKASDASNTVIEEKLSEVASTEVGSTGDVVELEVLTLTDESDV